MAQKTEEFTSDLPVSKCENKYIFFSIFLAGWSINELHCPKKTSFQI
jgi:hypothetical protein